MQDNDSFFETSDLNFAAFLRAREVPLVDVRREGRRTVWEFEIPTDTSLRELRSAWLSDGLVPAQTFANAIKVLKSSTFQE